MNDVAFGNWLKRSRKLRGLTQYDMEREAGLGRSHLSKMENGGIALPAEGTRKRLHKVLGTTDDDLVEAGILRKVQSAGYDPIYISAEDAVAELGTATATAEAGEISVTTEPLPAHLRASFLKASNWDPAKQKMLEDLIDSIDAAAQIQREELRRDEGK